MTNASAHLAEIYTLLCRSGLNKEYYGNVLHRTQRFNDLLEILIAVGTTGSGISAFTISAARTLRAVGMGHADGSIGAAGRGETDHPVEQAH